MKPHARSAEEVLHTLQANPKTGLSQEQVESSRNTYGENVFSREAPPSFLRRTIHAGSEPMILMLLFAACITLAVNLIRFFTDGEADFLECAGIFVAISLSVIITVVMEGRSAKAFEAISKINEDAFVKVLRSGTVQLIAQRELVTGDIVYVETGDKLAADGRLLECAGLQADESSLTGESVPVEKDASCCCPEENTPVAERKNMLYSGCFITAGSGVMVVTSVGNQTEFGKIATELSDTKKSSTPLQEKLDRLGKLITVLGAAAAAIVFIIQVALFVTQGTASLDTVSEAFITSIILIVAAVPEGLPTIVAVSLSINIIKMSRQNALVKKMIACETIGCINVICSDKTGTLTQNKMTVSHISEGGRPVTAERPASQNLIRNFCLNSSADLSASEKGRKSFIGNPTECALLVSAERAGFSYESIRSSADIFHVYPFSSDLKNMTTIEKKKDGFTLYSKGSPEKILAMCALPPVERAQAEQAIAGFQAKGSRVIAFAHRELECEPDCAQDREALEQGLHFDGFAAISDPLREDVHDAVRRCRSAGVSLKMLTGDNILTAKAIACELNLLDEGEGAVAGHRAVTAAEIEAMTENELKQALPSISVIARSTPAVKMRVVKALKEMGDVVAVTGDGINDAPAIKNADVGIAMGITGTDVSKEASDIVLLDDSFSTIVKAVQWGRGIYENFQRFIQFQLTVNLASVIVVLSSILSGFASPFTALQLLWINIVMDGPPALTLGLEPIRSDLLDQTPTPRNANILTRSMMRRITLNAVFISLVFMGQQLFNFLKAAPGEESTVLFTMFVVFQLFNAFNCRELNGGSIFSNLASNRLMLLIFTVTFALQVVITQWGGAFYGTVALSLTMWTKIIATSFSVILVSELFKLVQRTLQHSNSRKEKQAGKSGQKQPLEQSC